MPPRVPPAWFLLVMIAGASAPSPAAAGRATNGSLCTEPRIVQPSKPEPISKPFVAGSESIACAIIA